MDILQKYNQAILNELECLKSMKRDWNPKEITQDILLQNHELLCNNEDTVYLCTSHIRLLVGKIIAKNTMIKDDDSTQLTIPFIEGYDLIQSHYIIETNGEKIAKHIINMGEDEINLIADRMDKTAKSLIRHAKQLREFASAKKLNNIIYDI